MADPSVLSTKADLHNKQELQCNCLRDLEHSFDDNEKQDAADYMVNYAKLVPASKNLVLHEWIMYAQMQEAAKRTQISE